MKGKISLGTTRGMKRWYSKKSKCGQCKKVYLVSDEAIKRRLCAKCFKTKTVAMKKQTPPIGAQINHPDAFFYGVRISDDNQSIVGFFEAEETAQPFQFSILVAIHVARQQCLIDEYMESKGRPLAIYIDDGSDHGITAPALVWLLEFIEAETNGLQILLKECAAFQYEAAFPNRQNS